MSPQKSRKKSSRRGGSLLDAHPVHLRLLGQLHLIRESEEFQHAHAHPRHVDLPPLQAVPRAELERVVVVVPPLAEGEDADPPVVPAEVPGVVRLRAPHVRDGVHRPGDVVDPAGPDAEPPHEPRKAADGVERRRPRQHVPHVGLLEPSVEGLRGDLLRVAPIADARDGGLVVQQPPGVRPPEPLVRRVRVLRRVAVLMMVPVRARPLQRVALHRHRAAVRERVLHPLGRREGFVRQLAVVREGDPEAPRDEVHDEEAVERGPGEGEGGEQAPEVHDADEAGVRDVRGDPLAQKSLALGRVQHVAPEHLLHGLDALPRALGSGGGGGVDRRPDLGRLPLTVVHDAPPAVVLGRSRDRARHAEGAPAGGQLDSTGPLDGEARA